MLEHQRAVERARSPNDALTRRKRGGVVGPVERSQGHLDSFVVEYREPHRVARLIEPMDGRGRAAGQAARVPWAGGAGSHAHLPRRAVRRPRRRLVRRCGRRRGRPCGRRHGHRNGRRRGRRNGRRRGQRRIACAVGAAPALEGLAGFAAPAAGAVFKVQTSNATTHATRTVR